MANSKELEEAFTASTESFLRGDIKQGEYLVQVRAIHREIIALRKNKIKPVKLHRPKPLSKKQLRKEAEALWREQLEQGNLMEGLHDPRIYAH